MASFVRFRGISAENSGRAIARVRARRGCAHMRAYIVVQTLPQGLPPRVRVSRLDADFSLREVRLATWRDRRSAGITGAVSTLGARADSSGETPDGREELEELGNDAIVAHQTEAHLPQKRARVTEEAISVVISEPHASSQPITPPPEESTLTSGDATAVLDRKDLEAARRKILARRNGRKPSGGLALALVVAVVGGFGLLLFLGLKLGLSDRVTGAVAAPIANNARAPLPGAPSAAPVQVEGPPRAVSVDELPVERPQQP